MFLDLRLYQDHPEFCAAIKHIEAARSEALDAYLTRQEKTFHLPTAAECLAAYEAIEQEHEDDRIHAEYCQRIAEAHASYHVPVFAMWQEALKETGCAVFQYVLPLEYMPAMQVELRAGSDDTIMLTITQTRVFPKLLPEEEMEYSRDKRIGSYLLSHGIYTDSWTPTTPAAIRRRERDGLIRQILQRIHQLLAGGSEHHTTTALSV